ncbi:hypothetical protein Tco_0566126 [Tanacetum coccineum]
MGSHSKRQWSYEFLKQSNGVLKLPPTDAEEILARERERKARTTLLMALPEDHLAKFHKMTDAKRCFSVSNSEGLHKGYDRFQSLLSQLEIHGAGVSTKDANQKFLRSLLAAWSQIFLIMRTKPGVDSLSFDDLYNNLRVFEPRCGHDFHKTEEVLQKDRKKAAVLALIRPKSSATIVTRQGILLENAYLRGIKIVGGEMLDILGIKLMTSEEMEKRENLSSDTEYRNSGLYSSFKEGRSTTSCTSTNLPLVEEDIEAEKEKEELKAKVEKWHNSSKGLNILLNSQMSARDKAGLGYGNQMHKGVLSYENEVFGSVFDSRSSDIEDSPVNDRYAEGMHVVPPPMTGIYIPSGPHVETDKSQYIYGQKQSKSSESNAETSNFASCESNSSVEKNKSVPKPVANEPKSISDPKVWSDAPIIEEYESDSDDEHVSLPTKEHETPSFALVNNVTHVKTPKANFKEQNTCSRFSAFFIRDYDFHEKRMAKQIELNKQKGKGTVQRENKTVWNNVQRLNHQNKFVPTTILTRTGRFLINTARKVNTVRPIDNPQKALKNKEIVDSGCSRHMTGNKAYLVDYQDYKGGLVAFGGSKGYINGKDTECLVLSPDFKLLDENQVLLRVPR